MKLARILVVDDEEISLLTITEIVKDLAEVRTATSSEEAIELARTFKPDLLLLDINVDDANGFQIKDAIHRFLPESSVIYITTSDKYALDAYKNGGVDFITKPINMELTYNRVKNQLEMAHSKRALHIANQRIHEMLDSLDVAVFMTDENGIIVECNSQGASLTGYSVAELNTMKADDALILHSKTKKTPLNLVSYSLSEEEDFRSFAKMRLTKRTENGCEVMVQIKLLYETNGGVSGSSVIIHEIKGESDNTRHLAHREIKTRIRFLSDMIMKGSKIGEALSITAVKLANKDALSEMYGQEVISHIHDITIERLYDVISTDSVFGYLDDEHLLIVVPYFYQGNKDWKPSLACLDEEIYFLGESVSAAFNAASLDFPFVEGDIDDVITLAFDQAQ